VSSAQRQSAEAPAERSKLSLLIDAGHLDAVLAIMLAAAEASHAARPPLPNERWAARRAAEASRMWSLEESFELPPSFLHQPTKRWACRELNYARASRARRAARAVRSAAAAAAASLVPPARSAPSALVLTHRPRRHPRAARLARPPARPPAAQAASRGRSSSCSPS
jgi:hypothetical protein